MASTDPVLPAPDGLRIAVLVKQVPKFETMQLGADGRLVRDGAVEINPYCRRAVSKGVELAAETGGSCTAITLGPPSAEEALREAIAWGATDGILITDRAFSGSDTLATATALAAAVRATGPFDLILVGRNSVDADTGQVGPGLAELLDLPFLGAVRGLTLNGREVRATCERDDGWAEATTVLPAVLSCAERLCEPAKVDVHGRDAVTPDRIIQLTAADLGSGPWGQDGSPTSVGDVHPLEARRSRQRLSGPVGDQVQLAVSILRDRGALTAEDSSASDLEPVPPPSAVPGGPTFAVLLEPGRLGVARDLLGAAARHGAPLGATVVAIGAREALGDERTLAAWGADEAVELVGSAVEEDVAHALAGWCRDRRPWGLLVPGTMWGREVAGRAAARLGVGLTGDAVDLGVEDGRLVGFKPAFGGRLVAAITSRSEVQMVTVRPGVIAYLAPRAGTSLPTTRLTVAAAGRVRWIREVRDDEVDRLVRAAVVVGIGVGVAPEEYDLLAPLVSVLGAELAATRKVTDKGWQPRSRQIGVTGRSVGPRLYVAIGLSGKFNHIVGVSGAGQILAINSDPAAPVFDGADVGIVADWREAVPMLVQALTALTASAVAISSVDQPGR